MKKALLLFAAATLAIAAGTSNDKLAQEAAVELCDCYTNKAFPAMEKMIAEADSAKKAEPMFMFTLMGQLMLCDKGLDSVKYAGIGKKQLQTAVFKQCPESEKKIKAIFKSAKPKKKTN